ncbi:NAD+ synthase (glutamine-hydrolysing) [Thiothrix eikelboomii]|uniref:Glutamine-dependent NAD(+) synthetase n=1 Tax=Thiothrix eikelboomii TaxID=92487 RepID=A0A1T4X353_9GAMM|nr:NAD+ synthase [Thiothrix eikelboomii]SKA84044.1 NAD+ synthase (glutamine-hydrolysing) [Thiothrix eikelboomii]
MQKNNRSLSVALAQLNLCVGDIAGNTQQVIKAITEAKAQQADVIVFPELSLSSYPPEDLVYRADFLQQCEQAIELIKPHTFGITALVGLPMLRDYLIHNSAYVLQDGVIIGEYHKQDLPNYRVFDEKRWFEPGQGSLLVEIKGVRAGILICEDIWHDAPMEAVMALGAEVVLVLNASPYSHDKPEKREQVVLRQVLKHKVPMAYVNLVGGQDELVFDGDSMLISREGVRTLRAPLFEAGVFVGELAIDPTNTAVVATHQHEALEAHIYKALVTGVRDYVHKNGFKGVLLGLSGGIDSALTLAIAADALGAAHVEAIMMPFRYTAAMSVEDASEQARIMGVNYRQIPIEPIYDSFVQSLAPEFQGFKADVTEENLQARIRGMLLMSMSNKFGKLLLTTSNKSETAVGYATLYGDMAGAFGPLKDVYKTLVYRLAVYRNTLGVVIPERVITRPPSAELAPGQVDQDSLPPYAILDGILERFIEQDEVLETIVDAGFELATVRRVVNLVLLNEYKRRQAAPGVRITRRGFGKDWRYPMTSAWRKQLPLN